jgi:hypothetical protein
VRFWLGLARGLSVRLGSFGLNFGDLYVRCIWGGDYRSRIVERGRQPRETRTEPESREKVGSMVIGRLGKEVSRKSKDEELRRWRTPLRTRKTKAYKGVGGVGAAERRRTVTRDEEPGRAANT